MSEFNKLLLHSPIYWIILITCILIIVIYKLFYAKILGWFGELWTKQELNKLPKDKYKVINDVLILANGITHQIDHIVISKYGIFSIETKQYNGFITGSKYDKKWIRHCGKYKYYYTNPIRQNYGHVKSLSELLNINESKIYNVVCIPSRAKLKIKHDGELVRNYELVDKILSYKENIIEDVDEIFNAINRNNIKDRKIRKEHIKNIQKNKKAK